MRSPFGMPGKESRATDSGRIVARRIALLSWRGPKPALGSGVSVEGFRCGRRLYLHPSPWRTRGVTEGEHESEEWSAPGEPCGRRPGHRGDRIRSVPVGTDPACRPGLHDDGELPDDVADTDGSHPRQQ